jgi:hypothetical protein
MEDKIKELEEKIKIALDALEFYASGKVWEVNHMSGNSKLQFDQGRRAVEAVKFIKHTPPAKDAK